jgi:hypothetical protein
MSLPTTKRTWSSRSVGRLLSAGLSAVAKIATVWIVAMVCQQTKIKNVSDEIWHPINGLANLCYLCERITLTGDWLRRSHEDARRVEARASSCD